jgi:Tol biopolymer transport system component
MAGASLPSNLTAGAVFRPALERMWQSSGTFRRQCGRLSAAPQLQVNLLMEELARRPSSYRARAAMKRQSGALVSVHIHLTRFEDPIELIAHEIEHVIEQLEGVDLGAQAGTGNVWKREDGAFETQRAIEVGRRVAREVNAAEDPTASEGQEDSGGPRLHAIALHDRFPLLTGPPSGRVSPSGRQVVFTSYASLAAGDGNTTRDIYVMDVSTRRVTLETPGAGGHSANGESVNPDISRDGRFVVFESIAGNLANVEFARGIPRVFLRDRQTGIIRLLSTNVRGEPANGPSTNPAISADGETVVFISSASDILEDTAGSPGVYLTRLASNTRTRVDVTNQGQARIGQSASPAISADGRYVAFMSRADLTPRDGSSPTDDAPDGNGTFDIYVRDTVMQRTRRVSQSRGGRDTDGPSYHPAISGDGRFVAFVSEASNLTHDGSKRVAQIYLRDMETGATELISRAPAGRPGDAASARPVISGDGSVIAYQSLGSNLLCDDTCGPSGRDINLLWDVYAYDRPIRRTTRASSGRREEWMESSRGPSLDDTGRVLAFMSTHPSSPGDEGHDEDLFILGLESRMSGERPTGNSRSASDRRWSCCAGPAPSFRQATRPGDLVRRAP